VATLVLLPPDEARAVALREAGHEVLEVPPADAPVVLVGRRAGATDALERALATPASVAALVLVDPESRRDAADLAAVAAPTLLIASPGDPDRPIAVAEAHWRHIPTSRLVVETPGDVRLWERPHDLATRVTRFLREVLP
jgi:pimeloyl-ACP methyl ester carboxylesterase